MTYDPKTTMPTPEQEPDAVVRRQIADRLPAERLPDVPSPEAEPSAGVRQRIAERLPVERLPDLPTPVTSPHSPTTGEERAMTASEIGTIVERLRAACIGHPSASIPWPHRLLHEAADEIDRLNRLADSYEREAADHAQRASRFEKWHAESQRQLSKCSQHLAEIKAERCHAKSAQGISGTVLK